LGTSQSVRMPRPRTLLDLDEAKRLRKRERLSAAAIARKLEVTPAYLRAAFKREGVSLRPTRTMDEPHAERLRGLWHSVRSRCFQPTDSLYARYGAKGFAVSAEWQEFWRFYDWAIASGYRPGLNIEVVGRSRRFSPSTCRWITPQERMKRDGYPGGTNAKWMITAFGETKSTAEWERDPRCAVPASVLRTRIQKGVLPEAAIKNPSDRGNLLPKDPRRAQPFGGPRRTLDWGAIVRMHTEEDLAPAEIGPRVGAKPGTIRKGLKERGAWRLRTPTLHRRRLRKIWDNMRSRCENETDQSYRYYGALGAKVCPEWKEFRAFHKWGIDAGYKPGLCITRRAGTRIYSPGNCRWATREEVGLLAKHEDVTIPPRWTFAAFGERKGPTEWSRDPRCQVSPTGLLHRLRAGWRPEDAITAPPKTPGKSEVPTRLITAFGTTKGITAWARDRRCRVDATSLRDRLARGFTPEEAISTPPFKLRRQRGRYRRRAGHQLSTR
jgi:hypothetical protein